MLTTLAVLALTCSAFFAYEFVSFRQSHVRELTTLGQIISANSTAALAFDDAFAANEILSSLKVEPHIVAAVLFDKEGKYFSIYPPGNSQHVLPLESAHDGYQFEESHLHVFQPVDQGGKRLGTLYLKSDMGAMYERFQLYGAISALVVVLAMMLAYWLSKNLQARITTPILALTETAKAISNRQDYNVRAVRYEKDEIGLLTEAFNHMLTRIQEQTQALSESNLKVHAVINSALSAVIVMDSQGQITDWNAHAEKIFGWALTDVMGKDLHTLIIPENLRSAHRQGLSHFIKTGEGPVIGKLIEMNALRRGGSEFPIELSISVIRNGNEVSFCGFITDITERKRAEAEIQLFNQKLELKVMERTRELEMVNSELESFSYSVSHDLRAPLRSIHGYMNLLADEYKEVFDLEAKRLVEIILKNGQKMGQLIDDLLTFSRLGRKELIKANVSMYDIASTLADEIQKGSGRSNLEIIIHELPPCQADSSTLRQVWINLISNAVKYSKHKEKITVEIGSMKEGEELIYYVRDQGAGFDMNYYDKLFGVFQRLHSEKEFEGTGVGLAIVQRIVAKHGGRIWAEAKVNEGATFFFTLEGPASITGYDQK